MTRFFAPRLRRTAISLSIIVALLVVTLPLGGCSLADAFSGWGDDDPALASDGPTAATIISERLDTFATDLDVLADASAEPTATEAARASVEQFAEDFEDLVADLEDQFAETRDILAEIDSPEKDEIQADVEAEFAEKADTLREYLDDIEGAEGDELVAAATACAVWLDEVTPEPVYQPLGTELPHSVVDYEAGAPVLGTSIAPAYAPGLPQSEPSTLPVTPAEEDLAETIEVQFTEDIQSLVATLGGDPVAMYEYVRNTIDFEPYYGSRKGANEALLQGAGNDVDTASLLIAMYRNAGYPARYVSGVVDVPIDEAMNWVGVEVPEAAAKLFSGGGIPTTAVYSGAEISALRFEHTWLEAYVSYEDYRGVGSGERSWVPLDPSFKAYTYTEPLDIPGVASIPSEIVASEDATEVADVYAAALQDVAAYIDQQMPGGATFTELFGGRAIAPLNAGAIPATLPYSEHPSSEFAVIPFQLKWGVEIDLAADGRSEITTDLASLSGRQLTIEFGAASAADSELIGLSGGLSSAPAWSVEMCPCLTLDSVPLAACDPAGLGTAWSCSVTYVTPSGTRDTRVKVMTVGSTQSVLLGSGRTSTASLRDAMNRIDAVGEAMVSGDADGIPTEQYLGTLLRGTGLSYFAMCETLRRYTSFSYNVVSFSEPSLAFCGMSVRPATALGTVVGLGGAGLELDVQRDVFNCVERTDDQAGRREWLLLDGLLGSSGEHVVFEALLGERAISAQRAIRLAADSGIDIVHLRGGVDEPTMDKLHLEARVEDAIRTRLASGGEVIVPTDEVNYGDWTGVGWIEIDADGSSGFMISGGLAGGATVDMPRSEELNPTPEPTDTPEWSGGHPLLIDLLFSAFLGHATDYVPTTVADTRIPSGYREIDTGRFATTALGEAERATIVKLGAVAGAAAGLWEAVWQVIDDCTGPDATYYLANDLVVRRALLSFVVGFANGVAGFTVTSAVAAYDPRYAEGAYVAGFAASAVITVGWSVLKRQVFQALNWQAPTDSEIQLPRYADYEELPDLWDSARSVETVLSPDYK